MVCTDFHESYFNLALGRKKDINDYSHFTNKEIDSQHLREAQGKGLGQREV